MKLLELYGYRRFHGTLKLTVPMSMILMPNQMATIILSDPKKDHHWPRWAEICGVGETGITKPGTLLHPRSSSDTQWIFSTYRREWGKRSLRPMTESRSSLGVYMV